MELQLGAAAPDALLLDASDREVPLRRLCAETPLVLIFLRHFG